MVREAVSRPVRFFCGFILKVAFLSQKWSLLVRKPEPAPLRLAGSIRTTWRATTVSKGGSARRVRGVLNDCNTARYGYSEVLMAAIKHSKITIRQPAPLKAKIEPAAAMRGMTVTSFINGVLEFAADKTVSRVRARELTARDSRALMAMLSKPGRPNASLKKAAKKYREFMGGKDVNV